MSNTAMAAIIMAMVLILASVHAQAREGALSEKQVRALIKKEVAKIPRGPAGPRGPRGAPGPAGADGMPAIFAHVLSDGTVEEGTGGIAQENVRLEERQVPDDTGAILTSASYCFIGLPPVVGGQVTIDGHEGPGGLISPSLQLNSFDTECPIRVFFNNRSEFAAPAAFFYILLY